MALILSKNFAPCMLILTSIHGLNRLSRHFYYARTAFKLHLVCGCLLLVQNFGTDFDFTPAILTTWIWCYCLGLPLTSAELCSNSVALPEFTNIQLIVPIYSVIAFHASPKRLNPYHLGVSHIFSLTCLTILSLAGEEISYLVLALFYYYTQFRLSPYEHTEPAYFENWCFLISFVNFYSYQLLNRYRNSE